MDATSRQRSDAIAAKTRMPFMDFPAEIRDEVYKFIFTDPNSTVIFFHDIKELLPALQVNSEFRNEGLKIFWGQCRIILGVQPIPKAINGRHADSEALFHEPQVAQVKMCFHRSTELQNEARITVDLQDGNFSIRPEYNRGPAHLFRPESIRSVGICWGANVEATDKQRLQDQQKPDDTFVLFLRALSGLTEHYLVGLKQMRIEFNPSCFTTHYTGGPRIHEMLNHEDLEDLEGATPAGIFQRGNDGRKRFLEFSKRNLEKIIIRAGDLTFDQIDDEMSAAVKRVVELQEPKTKSGNALTTV